jgi:hypothetical protein
MDDCVEYEHGGTGFRMDVSVAERLERSLDEFFWSDAADPDAEEQPPTPSGVYFCGCSTCSTRETLVIATAVLLDAISEGLVERLPAPAPAPVPTRP